MCLQLRVTWCVISPVAAYCKHSGIGPLWKFLSEEERAGVKRGKLFWEAKELQILILPYK